MKTEIKELREILSNTIERYRSAWASRSPTADLANLASSIKDLSRAMEILVEIRDPNDCEPFKHLGGVPVA